MTRLAVALVLLAATAGLARADAAAFQALGADAQKIVNKVTGDKPEDTAVCAGGGEELRSKVVSATKSLYFAGSLAGEPKPAGEAAGEYLKALCKL
jgi:hypothetical protein